MYEEQSGVCSTPMMQTLLSKPAGGLAKIMTVTVEVFEATGLTVSEKKTEAMLLRTPK